MTFAPPKFTTLGCRLNAYETEAMKDLAAQAGLDGAVVINTCAVTSEAVRKATTSNPGERPTLIEKWVAAGEAVEANAAMPPTYTYLEDVPHMVQIVPDPVDLDGLQRAMDTKAAAEAKFESLVARQHEFDSALDASRRIERELTVERLVNFIDPVRPLDRQLGEGFGPVGDHFGIGELRGFC